MLNALFLSIPSSTSTNVTYPATNACILYVQRSSGRTTHDLSLVLVQESSTSHEERARSMKYSLLKYVSRMGRWLHDRNEIQRQRWRLTWSNRNGIFVSWHRWLYGDGRTTITDPAILLSVSYRFVSRNKISLNYSAIDLMQNVHRLSGPVNRFLSSVDRFGGSGKQRCSRFVNRLKLMFIRVIPNLKISQRILTFTSFVTETNFQFRISIIYKNYQLLYNWELFIKL